MRLVLSARSARLAILMAFGLLALCPRSGSADLYEWTEEDGRVHYSNEPRPGARPVGLTPLALEPEGSGEDDPTEANRRDRLKRQRADQWVDSQQALPTQDPDPIWATPEETHPHPPAAPAEDDYAIRERTCQQRHGMSCLRYEAWLRSRPESCPRGAAGQDCEPVEGPDEPTRAEQDDATRTQDTAH